MDRRIYSLIDVFLDDLKHHWTNDEMARYCNLSTSHFVRLFREQTLSTPNSFLNNARLDRVEILLLQTDFLLLKEIGVAVGFVNYTHFARDFKKRTGLSLSAFRQRGWNKKTILRSPGNQ